MRACVSELFNITYPRLTYPRCFGFEVFLFVFFVLFNFFLPLITVLDEGKKYDCYFDGRYKHCC